MRRAHLALVVDLSLPLAGEAQAAALGAGLRTLLALLERKPTLRLEVALAGGVTQALLRWGQERSLQVLAERASAGQISFLTTACWGAFLPLAPVREAARQLDLTERVNREALGEWVWRAEGLFPPQLGYSRSVAELACARGLRRVLADSLAWPRGRLLPRDRHFLLQGREGCDVFFVDRALSQSLEESPPPDLEKLHRLVAARRSGYAVLRVPGRTLSGARAPHALLSALGRSGCADAAMLDEIRALFPEVEPVEPMACALGTEPSELAAGIPFAKWSAPGNELHALLWRLAQLASEEAFRLEGEEAGGAVHSALDESLDCAAWRYASSKPELEPGRVMAGGHRLVRAIRAGGRRIRPDRLEEAEELYSRLLHRCEAAAAARAVGAASARV